MALNVNNEPVGIFGDDGNDELAAMSADDIQRQRRSRLLQNEIRDLKVLFLAAPRFSLTWMPCVG